MALTRRISEKADDQLSAILHYRLTHHSSRSAENFMRTVDEAVVFLLENPDAGRLSNRYTEERKIRYRQIARSHYLYYAYDDVNLIIIEFISVRSSNNPYED